MSLCSILEKNISREEKLKLALITKLDTEEQFIVEHKKFKKYFGKYDIVKTFNKLKIKFSLLNIFNMGKNTLNCYRSHLKYLIRNEELKYIEDLHFDYNLQEAESYEEFVSLFNIQKTNLEIAQEFLREQSEGEVEDFAKILETYGEKRDVKLYLGNLFLNKLGENSGYEYYEDIDGILKFNSETDKGYLKIFKYFISYNHDWENLVEILHSDIQIKLEEFKIIKKYEIYDSSFLYGIITMYYAYGKKFVNKLLKFMKKDLNCENFNYLPKMYLCYCMVIFAREQNYLLGLKKYIKIAKIFYENKILDFTVSDEIFSIICENSLEISKNILKQTAIQIRLLFPENYPAHVLEDLYQFLIMFNSKKIYFKFDEKNIPSNFDKLLLIKFFFIILRIKNTIDDEDTINALFKFINTGSNIFNSRLPKNDISIYNKGINVHDENRDVRTFKAIELMVSKWDASPEDIEKYFQKFIKYIKQINLDETKEKAFNKVLYGTNRSTHEFGGLLEENILINNKKYTGKELIARFFHFASKFKGENKQKERENLKISVVNGLISSLQIDNKEGDSHVVCLPGKLQRLAISTLQGRLKDKDGNLFMIDQFIPFREFNTELVTNFDEIKKYLQPFIQSKFQEEISAEKFYEVLLEYIYLLSTDGSPIFGVINLDTYSVIYYTIMLADSQDGLIINPELSLASNLKDMFSIEDYLEKHLESDKELFYKERPEILEKQRNRLKEQEKIKEKAKNLEQRRKKELYKLQNNGKSRI